MVHAKQGTLGQAAGLFLAPTHMIEPEVTFANIIAFVEAVKAASEASGGPPLRFPPGFADYVVEVKIETSEVTGDPEATLRKAQQIAQAAFAPGDPRAEDRRAATMAAAMAARARQELARQKE